jgi:glycosyltransferase involved in cell wall biosynthesis
VRRADVVYLNGGVPARVLPAVAAARTGPALRAAGPTAPGQAAPVSRTARRSAQPTPHIVLHIHDMVTRVPPFWRLADVVLAASGAVAGRMRALHPHVVYGPVDPDPPAASAPWGTGDGPVIGFIGRLEPRKGPLDLVRAAPLIRSLAPNARIVIVGDEPYCLAPDYTRQVRASTDVEHHAWVENAPGVMRHLDVLVLPSYEEPFGTVLAEAMAVGTPVVAARVDGLPEVVVDGVTGRLVEPGNPQRLAEAVLDVLAHRERMGGAARTRAERFHAERYVERVERLLAA